MKNPNTTQNPKQAILVRLKKLVSVVEVFLNEVKKNDALSDKALSDRYAVFVADGGSEITVKDKGLNVPVFTLKNTFVKGGEHYTVASTAAFQKSRYPETLKAFQAL